MLRRLPCLFTIVVILGAIFCPPAISAERITLKDGDLPEKLQKNEIELLEKCRQLENHLEKSGILSIDRQLEDYINQIAFKLAPKDLPCRRKPNFEFKIARDPTINAFSLPTGKIYLHSGLIARLDNEAQLASVLGHEISHTLNRDAFYFTESLHNKTVSYKLMDLLLTPVAAIFTGGAVGSLGLDFLYIASVTGYSKEQEAKADADSIEMMRGADYYPQEAVRVFDILIEEAKKYRKDIEIYFLARHPSNVRRKEELEEILLTISDEPNKKVVNREAYQDMTSRIKIDDAVMNMKIGRYQHALERLHSLPDEMKNSAPYHFHLAEIYRNMFEDPKRLLIESSDTERNRLMKIKEPARKEEYYNDALKEYKAAIDIDNLYADAHRGLGLLYIARGERKEAFERLREYLKLNPDAKDERFVKRCLADLKIQMQEEQVAKTAKKGD